MEIKSNFEDFRKILIELCREVLQGNLDIEEFFARWPDEIPKTPFVSALFDDLEDGVEHFPGHWFSGEKNFQAWESSDMAYRLGVDTQLLKSGLLKSGLREEHMLYLRKIILDKDITDKEEIKRLISEQKVSG